MPDNKTKPANYQFRLWAGTLKGVIMALRVALYLDRLISIDGVRRQASGMGISACRTARTPVAPPRPLQGAHGAAYDRAAGT
jgi:hypothetical protein